MNFHFRKPTKQLAAAAAGIALALSLPQAAHAGAHAYSEISYSDFLFTNNSAGNTALQLGVEVQLNGLFSDESLHTVSRNGVIAPNIETEDDDPTDGIFVDGAVNCLGSCGGVAENDFGRGDSDNDEYVRADSLVQGSGLDLSAFGLGVDTGTMNFVSEGITQLGTDDTATSAFSNVTRFSIILAADTILGVSFDAESEIFALLHPDAQPGSVAQGNTDFAISISDSLGNDVAITDNNLGTDDAATRLTRNRVNGEPGTTIDDIRNVSVDLETAAALTAGEIYTLTLNFGTRIRLDATKQVPEPGPLALMSLGLLGLTFRMKGKRA